MDDQTVLRKRLLALLRGHGAHATLSKALEEYPAEIANEKPAGAPYTPWAVLEHMRLCQRDILDFIREAEYQSPDWPGGFWPNPREEVDAGKWRETERAFLDNNHALQEIVQDRNVDLFEPLPHGEKYTILREIEIIGDHNSYHLGQLMLMKRLLASD